jgi:hypothetical protein
MADNDDNKVILTLREAEAYDGDGFFFCPSEVRDPPPTFRYAIALTSITFFLSLVFIV